MNYKLVEDEENYKILSYLKQKYQTCQVDIYQQKLFPDFYDLISRYANEELVDLCEKLKDQIEVKQSSMLVIDKKIEGILIEKNQQEREKYKLAVENVSKLLYIDIVPLLLDDLGFTKENIIQPFSKNFQLNINFENLDQTLVRNNSEIYYENEINLNELQDLLQRTQSLIEKIIKNLTDDYSYKTKFYLKYNDIRFITNNLAHSISELAKNDNITHMKYYDMEFQISELFYLKLSILQICQQMVEMMLNQYERINQVEIDYQKKIDQLRNMYSFDLIEFFEKCKNRTDDFTKQQLYEEIKNLLPNWNFSEKKQLITLSEMEQSILNEENDEIEEAYLHTYMKGQDIPITSKKFQENLSLQNNQLVETQNYKQEIPQIEQHTLKQQETQQFLKYIQEEQETQLYKLMFKNRYSANYSDQLNEQTVIIQAFKDLIKSQDSSFNNLFSNKNANLKNQDEQTISYKIENMQEKVLNKQKILSQEQKYNFELEDQQIRTSFYTQKQNNLDIQNATVDFQLKIKLNQNDKQEEEQKIVNYSQAQSSIQNNSLNEQASIKENNFPQIQSLIFKKSNDLHKIGHLGKGGQAGVEFYYDFKQKKRYALKNFKNQFEYLKEKNTHINYLLEDKNPKLSSYVCQLVSFDDQNCQILLEIGLCSLQDAFKIQKKNNLQISINYFVNILIKIISFNIQMNKIGLYHSDIKPSNMVLYLDQNELSSQYQFGFKLVDFENIQLKFIDFASCSNDPDYYYEYQTPKYKYYGYQNQNMNFKKILFAETYSACKSIYFLLDEQLQKKMGTISYDNQLENILLQEELEENKLLFFLQMFLCDNEAQIKMSQVGVSVDELIYLTEKYLGKISEFNKSFKCNFINAYQVGQWQKISEIKSASINDSVEYQIFNAFAFINKLDEIFSQEKSQNEIYEIANIKTKNVRNFNQENDQILQIALDIFQSITDEVSVNPIELIERIYLLDIEIQQQHSLIYEFLITIILEKQKDFDEQTAFIKFKIQ
ncbi:hypothetical protein TTHERM_00194020 (macronuclear) [Tetrahymena thermophila SB210]|uniref:Protein kinase domain-containing protein n=1 Tax=Tetrahymena thermophila (strain SB210) TaxID=312017 RepID=Q23KD3_TETTS|nr:hypothetical protein TTHERM_00194020 [Tetrahymena thermophila SB210]EAR96910.2 hypothetical protein TTHERM_00194020 [Tetrahymena thermophila SB210]|eukprot:XP_001017155.2 hypothetical protein TTHERM_00194020 [Tetrahymena thermophila SB210]